MAGVSWLGVGAGEPVEGLMKEAEVKAEKRMSLAEILVPSAVFQIVMLGAAGWVFARRDF